MINLSSFIAFHARRTPDRIALKYRGEDVSYADFDHRIRMVGGWLAGKGITAGDVVAVLMKNSTAFLELVFAASHIGAVFLPINFRLSSDEVAYIIGNSGARILIADDELASIAAAARRSCCSMKPHNPASPTSRPTPRRRRCKSGSRAT